MNNKYTIIDNYHGDVKYIIVDKPKKVDLSKPTDVLEHRVKHQYIPDVYGSTDHLAKRNSSEVICLTKPRDLPTHYEELKVKPNEPIRKHIQNRRKSESIKTIVLTVVVIAIALNPLLNLLIFQDVVDAIGHSFNSILSLGKIL